jgi:hypothetical protein
MKPSVKFYIFSGLLFALAVFILITSQRIASVSSKPFEATVEKAEQSDISGYAYFKLSEGYVVPYATVYEVEEPGNKVTQVVYPFVSAAYLEKARAAYSASHNDAFDEDGFIEWFETYTVKPKFYVQAHIDEMSETEMYNLVVADSLAKSVEGIRITSFVSVSTHITDIYEKEGITPENAVFIDGGSTPEKEKESANVLLVLGGIIGVVSLVLFFLGRKKASSEEHKRQMIERFK